MSEIERDDAFVYWGVVLPDGTIRQHHFLYGAPVEAYRDALYDLEDIPWSSKPGAQMSADQIRRLARALGYRAVPVKIVRADADLLEEQSREMLRQAEAMKKQLERARDIIDGDES